MATHSFRSCTEHRTGLAADVSNTWLCVVLIIACIGVVLCCLIPFLTAPVSFRLSLVALRYSVRADRGE
jgi:hypothetical protein